MKASIKLEDDVREVLAKAEVEGNLLRLTGQLERKLYERTNKALEALGGKWNRSKKAHVFDGDPRAAIAAAFNSGEVAHPNQLDFFPTPPEIANLACQRLGYERGHRVLEPSAGEGDLIAPLIAAYGKPAIGGLVLIEKDPRRISALQRKGFGSDYLTAADFLSVKPPCKDLFDRVIMNPPFHRGADADHVGHALDFVAPGGRIVAIVSGSFRTREDKKTRLVRERLTVWGVHYEDLLAGSFKEAGTNVSTSLLTAIRPATSLDIDVQSQSTATRTGSAADALTAGSSPSGSSASTRAST